MRLNALRATIRVHGPPIYGNGRAEGLSMAASSANHTQRSLMFALASRWHTQSKAALVSLRVHNRLCRRTYAQQRVSRTPQSAPQQSTSKPSPTSQVKNRTLDTNAAQRVFQQKKAAADGQGVDALLPAMMAMKGTDLWAQKFPLLGATTSLG